MYTLSLGINFARVYLSSAVRKSSLNSNAVSPLQLEIFLSDLTLAPPYYSITELIEALPADINITKLTQAEQQCHVCLIFVSGPLLLVEVCVPVEYAWSYRWCTLLMLYIQLYVQCNNCACPAKHAQICSMHNQGISAAEYLGSERTLQ